MAGQQRPLCRPAKREDFEDPLATVDQIGWLGPSIRGWKMLCLAAGGGRQSALYAAAGADVTVVDLSPQMLELDRQMAEARRCHVRAIEASMDHLPMLRDGEFDAVVHPVSTCYLPDISAVYREVARVTRPGGLYISQHKQPLSLQATIERTAQGDYAIEHPYYRDAPVPPPKSPSRVADRLREPQANEYLHRWEQLIGGLCRSGFVIEDLVEPVHGKRDAALNGFADRARYIPPYVRIKARRRQSAEADGEAVRPRLVLPFDGFPGST
jgi:ubiquinone/menaquinone biosynthesis C-methylase UbiE